jgi:hypothetical protein
LVADGILELSRTKKHTLVFFEVWVSTIEGRRQRCVKKFELVEPVKFLDCCRFSGRFGPGTPWRLCCGGEA